MHAGDYVPIGYWSTVEVHVSVICASLPALPSLFRKRLSPAKTQQTRNSLPDIQVSSEPKSSDVDWVPVPGVSVHHRDTPPGQIRVLSTITVTSARPTESSADKMNFSNGPATIREAMGYPRSGLKMAR